MVTIEDWHNGITRRQRILRDCPKERKIRALAQEPQIYLDALDIVDNELGIVKWERSLHRRGRF